MKINEKNLHYIKYNFTFKSKINQKLRTTGK